MIDKICYFLFGTLDKWCAWVDDMFTIKPKKKKKKQTAPEDLFNGEQMKISENTSVAMPIKNMVGIIIGVAMGIFAYTEITARLTSLETSRELMNADLLKASEQTTVDKEQFLLLEDLYETIEKHQELLDKNIHNQVMLTHIEKQLEKALNDIEELKDANREMKYTNGSSH